MGGERVYWQAQATMPGRNDRELSMRVDKRWWFVVGVLGFVALFFAFDLGHYLNLATIKSRQADLEAWRAAQPLVAGVLFFAAYVAASALSLPGATVMTLAAGAIFGLGWGLLIVSFASSIALMATSNSPTYGHSNSPGQDQRIMSRRLC